MRPDQMPHEDTPPLADDDDNAGLRLYMSSRRTICDGEVVTFAVGFTRCDFGGFDSTGPFEVSASRSAVVVHRAACESAELAALLIEAIKQAEAVRANLADTWMGGRPSKYPAEPTLCKIKAREGGR